MFMRTTAFVLGLFALANYSVALAQADADNDTLPDAWETANGLSPSDPADATIDSNGNGVINLLEYAFGGNPTGANSTLLPRGAAQPGNIFTVTFNRRLDPRFSIQPERASEVDASWSTDGFALSAQQTLAADLEQVTYRLEAPTTTESQQFVRVAVRLLPPPAAAPQFVYRVIDSTILHGQGVTPADIDADGDIDLVACYSATDAIYLYLNGANSNGNGAGATWSTIKIAPDNSIVAMQTAVADFDGDGDLDVAAVEFFDRSCTFCAPGKLVWYERPANITDTWTRRSIKDDFWGARFVSAADLNGDGRADLIASANDIGGNGNGLFWFRNSGNGATWSAAIPVDAALLQAEVARAQDVDGNGVIDIVALGKNSNIIAWYENGRAPGAINNTPAFTRREISMPNAPDNFIFANVDADPALELLASSERGLEIYNRPADIRQPWTPTPLDTSFGSGNNSRLFAADFDNDGLTDLAAGSGSLGELRWYKNPGSGDWTPTIIQTSYNGLTEVIGADLNNDGRPDLITTTYNFDTTDRLAWWDNQPSTP